jgi:hypothetical protein
LSAPCSAISSAGGMTGRPRPGSGPSGSSG